MALRVKKIQDNDNHWYWIAESDLVDFKNYLNRMDGIDYMDNPDLFDEFSNKYEGYRTGGDPDNVPDPLDGNIVEFVKSISHHSN